jgi:starvation-inducible DNA-binding protein
MLAMHHKCIMIAASERSLPMSERITNFPGTSEQTLCSERDRQDLALGLSKLLADSYMLYLKTHSFHWNVTGPLFNTLRLIFESQYAELSIAVDLIAERIRALDLPVPGSFQQFSILSTVLEETGAPSAKDMLRQLMDDQALVANTARSVFELANAANDHASTNLLTQRIQSHEKNAWTLRSLLQ